MNENQPAPDGSLDSDPLDAREVSPIQMFWGHGGKDFAPHPVPADVVLEGEVESIEEKAVEPAPKDLYAQGSANSQPPRQVGSPPAPPPPPATTTPAPPPLGASFPLPTTPQTDQSGSPDGSDADLASGKPNESSAPASSEPAPSSTPPPVPAPSSPSSS